MTKSRTASYRQRRLQSLFVRIGAEIAITAAAFVAIYFIGIAFFNSRTWQADDPVYIAGKLIRQNLLAIAVVVAAVGLVVIFVRAWLRANESIETILQATRQVSVDDDTLIELPGDLQDFESEINQVKLEIRRNERLAQESEQRKNDLIVYLAHDLKTPLTSVIGYLSLLNDERDLPPKAREKYVGISLAKAERLEDLINEFFDIARFNLSHITLEKSEVNVTQMLEQMVSEFQPLLAPKSLTVDLTYPTTIMAVIDVDKMERVFDNLLQNAVNYSTPGTTIHIDVAENKAANDLTFRFTNQGREIPAEKLSRIFEQFYRLDSARATKTGGAGLGLAIAQHIVELHGGTIAAHSAGQTTTFDFTIPRS